MFELFILSLEKESWLNGLIILIILGLSITASLHAVVYKRESRAAIGWFAVIVASPILGSLLYYFLGINRIEKKARKLKMDDLHTPNQFEGKVEHNPRFLAIKKTGESLSYSPACSIGDITALNTGDEAYPVMLEAINGAKKTISLFSYIFTADHVGMEFLNRLEQAIKRGVQVRLMVDGVGSKKTLGKLEEICKQKDIPLGIFLRVRWRPKFANLRNHRKLLIVDGKIGFTGGLNIAEIYWPSKSHKEKVLDFHFRMTGPIVSYLQAVFSDDWFFTTKEELDPYIWKPQQEETESDNLARVVVDGPGDKQEKMRWHFLSAINSAQNEIRIITPYFLPDTGVSTALISAALRGVDVNVIIPAEGDHALVTWAIHGSLWELLRHGVKIWHAPPPFDHSKLFIVDDDYMSIGSSNWDPRSLRLNFELNVELYCPAMAQELIKVFDKKLSRTTAYTLDDHENRAFFTEKVRDGFARMLSPYL